MVDTTRHHYQEVSFVVPNFAMSAGTVLVMSGDTIYMDYFSTLGPIDPQIKRGGAYVPALGYLKQFERLVDKSRSGKLTSAEAAYLLQRFDPAELYRFEQAKNLSNTLLKQWLVKYKFKNWKRTQTRRRPVTRQMKVDRANEIADKLNDTDYWHSHAHGISMDVVKRHLKLKIEDFGKNRDVRDTIGAYYKLVRDYMRKLSLEAAIHTRTEFAALGVAGG